MRSNEEQVQHILEKYATLNKKQKTKNKKIAIILCFLCCATILTVSISFFQKTILHNKHNPPINTDSIENHLPILSTENKGVILPKIEIPDSNEGMLMDMIAMVVYNENVYTCPNMAYPYSLSYNEQTKQILDTYLGKGNGKINCFSEQSDYNGQFTSNTTFDFYTVRGYDDNFRIGAVCEFTDGTEIVFFDCLNGITLYKGCDLFEDRLHLTGNFTEVLYQLHDDWNYDRGNFKKPEVLSDENIEMFLQTLNQSKFTEINDSADLHKMYDKKQAHLYFVMHDSTTVGIRLLEGGYAQYDGAPPNLFIHMSENIFDTVFNATTV